MRIIGLFLALLVVSSCKEDRYSKEKFDETIVFTNESSQTIERIKISGSNKAETKIFLLEEILPKESKSLTFNIRRDLKEREGTVQIMAFLASGDSLYTSIYFTNWQIPLSYNSIYISEDKIVIKE